MTSGSNTVRSLSSKALAADSISATDPVRAFGETLVQAWKWLTRHSRGVLTHRVSRRLKVAETVSLGEKRFVSIVQVDGEQFLVGGSSSNIVLLAKLEEKAEILARGSFESVFSHAASGTGSEETDRNRRAEVAR